MLSNQLLDPIQADRSEFLEDEGGDSEEKILRPAQFL